jgi:[ribosomal protein S5]-alanine N-acetyltransferase
VLPSVVEGSCFRLRPWAVSDKAALVRYANNWNVARSLRDLFPFPYTEADADRWLARAAGSAAAPGIYAIEVGGEAAGCVAVERQADVERLSAEIGYWLGEPFWGRGIMTEAVARLTALALAESDIVRLFAPVFAWNAASMRVLEKNGYAREAVLRRSGFKDGKIFDRVIYSRVKESAHPYVAAT